MADQGIPEEQWNSASGVVDPDGTGPRSFFQQVSEPKSVKNRVHLDVIVGLRATRRYPVEQRGEHWVVMDDPECNEFCLQ